MPVEAQDQTLTEVVAGVSKAAYGLRDVLREAVCQGSVTDEPIPPRPTMPNQLKQLREELQVVLAVLADCQKFVQIEIAAVLSSKGGLIIGGTGKWTGRGEV